MSRFFRIIPNKRIIGSYQWRNLSRFGVNNFVFSQKSLFASAPHPNNGTNVALNDESKRGNVSPSNLNNGGNRDGGSSWFEYLRTVPGAILGGCTIIGGAAVIYQFAKKARADRDWDNRIISTFSTPIPAFDDADYYVSRTGDEYTKIKSLCTPDVSSYSYVITGKKMIGKSTMVRAAINELRGEYFNIAYFDFAGGKIDGFDKTLNAFPRTTYGFYSHLHPTDGPAAFRRTLGAAPSQLAKMKRNDDKYHQHINTLILDSVNELSDEHLDWLLGFVKGCVDNGLLKVIMVVSPGKTLSKIAQNRYTQGRIFMGYHVTEDMTDKEATQYIKKWSVVDDDKIIDVIKDVTGKRVGYLRQIMTVFDKEFGTKDATKENMIKILFENVLKGRINEAIQGFKDIKMTSKEIGKLLFETLPNGTLTEPQYEILSDSNIVGVNKKEKKLEWECKPIKLCFNTESVKNDIELQIKYRINY